MFLITSDGFSMGFHYIVICIEFISRILIIELELMEKVGFSIEFVENLNRSLPKYKILNSWVTQKKFNSSCCDPGNRKPNLPCHHTTTVPLLGDKVKMINWFNFPIYWFHLASMLPVNYRRLRFNASTFPTRITFFSNFIITIQFPFLITFNDS